MPAPRTKRVVEGLIDRIIAFRGARKRTQPQAAVFAGLSLETWRMAELYALASDETLAKLKATGVDLAGLKSIAPKHSGRARTSGAATV